MDFRVLYNHPTKHSPRRTHPRHSVLIIHSRAGLSWHHAHPTAWKAVPYPLLCPANSCFIIQDSAARGHLPYVASPDFLKQRFTCSLVSRNLLPGEGQDVSCYTRASSCLPATPPAPASAWGLGTADQCSLALGNVTCSLFQPP